MRYLLFACFGLFFLGCSAADPCADRAAPNGSPSAASPLVAGATVGDRVACVGQEDWYAVELATGQTLTAHATIPGAAPDSLQLSVHTASGTPVAAAIAEGDGLTVTTQPGAAGHYLLRVSAVADRASYSLSATIADATQTCEAGTHPQNGACVADGCEDGGLEPNPDFTGARRIVAGRYEGLRTCAGDQDYYVISAPPGGGALQVSITGIDGTDVDVYASDGTMNGPIPNLLAAGQSPGEADYLTNVPLAPGGEVFFFVTGGQAGYTMEVSWTALDPARDCLTDCRTIVAFDGPIDPADPAAVTAGYFNGSEPAYLFARRDFAMQLQWAFKQTAEHFPNTHPVYVSDIGQADGKVPGTDVGEPRHPPDAHINGHDADIAYYQTMPDNDYRIVCGDGSDKNGNGQPGKYNDGYFCTTDQNVVDLPRQAYFLGMMAENPLYHVTGVDETLPDQIIAAADALAASGDLPARAAYRINYGLASGNINLWPFHHHHCHVQLWNPNQPRLPLWYDGWF